MVRRWQTHRDRSALRCLVEAHAGFVVATARRYARRSAPVEDLVSEGWWGFLAALERFDPERSLRLVTYATYWIRARMVHHVLASWSIVSTGSRALRSKNFFRLRREHARLAAQLGDPSAVLDELSGVLRVPREPLRAMLHHLDAGDVSTDAPSFDDGASTFGDTLRSTADVQDEEYAAAERRALVARLVTTAMSTLDERERLIIERRVLADDATATSLAALGRQLGISRERARQLEQRALAKLRRSIARASRRAHLSPHDLATAA